MVPAFHAPVSGKPDAHASRHNPLLVAEADEGILSGDPFPLRPSNEHNAWGSDALFMTRESVPFPPL